MFTTDHDYHIHTVLSTCSGDPEMIPENIIAYGEKAGLKEMVITNHFWDSKMPGADNWYGPQDLSHIKKSLPLPKSSSVKMMFGCETEFCGGTKIGISPESYDEFDFIIVPFNHLHNNFSRPVNCTSTRQVADLFMDHFEDLMKIDLPWRKVGIAHLTCGLTYPGPKLHEVFDQLDETRMKRCFALLASRGAGIELNACCFADAFRQYPESLLKVYIWAKEEGCKFYCGSDAHHIGDLAGVANNLPSPIKMLSLDDSDRFII